MTRSTSVSTSASANPNGSPAKLDLPSLVRRLELILRDIRAVATEHERAARDKGVLGSRGLTEFVIESLKRRAEIHSSKEAHYDHSLILAIPVTLILQMAESAGYSIPTSRTMSKRLTERAYRVGDIAWDEQAKGWYWKGTS